MDVLATLRSNWFIVALLLVILVAYTAPDIGRAHGWLQTQVTVKHMITPAVFVVVGMSLDTKALLKAASEFKMFALVLIGCFGLAPMVIWIISHALNLFITIQPQMLDGLCLIGYLPMATTSSVVYATNAGGNDAIALFSSSLGSLIGVIITPFLVSVFLFSGVDIPVVAMIWHLVVSVQCPILIGQVTRYVFEARLAQYNPPYGLISNWMLLAIIFASFSDIFAGSATTLGGGEIVVSIVVAVMSQCSHVVVCYFVLVHLLGYSLIDFGGMLFATFHKSLAIAIMVIQSMYGGDSVGVVYGMVPLLCYHPVQLTFGAVLCDQIRRRIPQTPSA